MIKYLLPFIILSSCSKENDFSWVDYYKENITYKKTDYKTKTSSHKDDKVISIRLDGVKFSTVMKTITDRTGISIAWDSKLDDRPVIGFYKNKKVSVIIESIARRFGSSVTQVDDVWFVGTLKSEDRANYLSYMPTGNDEVITKTIQTMLSESGRVSVLSGSIMVSDHNEKLRKIIRLLEDLKSRSATRYFAEIHFIKVNKDDVLKLGVEFEAKAVNLVNNTSAEQLFNAMLKADYVGANADVLINPIMFLSEGITSSMTTVQVIPVENKAVTEGGAIETVGYEDLSAGILIKLNCRKLNSDKYTVKLDLEVSSFTGLTTTDRPIKDSRTIDSSIVLHDDETVLIGSIVSKKKASKFTFITGEFENSDEIILIFLKVREFDKSSLSQVDIKDSESK